MTEPSSNGGNGRGRGKGKDKRGRFTKGNQYGRGGHALAVKMAQVRTAYLRAISPKNLEKIIRVLEKKAVAGEPWAIKEVLKYSLGRPVHLFDPRQGLPAEGEQQQQGPQYTAQERLIIARTMAAQAERELRGEEAIEAEGEEVRDGSADA